MTIDYQIFSDMRLFTTRYRGVTCFSEAEKTYAKILVAARKWPDATEISDLRDTEAFRMSPNDIRDFSERMAGLLARSGIRPRNALIAATDTQYGLACVYHSQAIYCGRDHINVVRDVPDAAEWVGMEREALERMLKSDQRSGFPGP